MSRGIFGKARYILQETIYHTPSKTAPNLSNYVNQKAGCSVPMETRAKALNYGFGE